MNGPFPFLPTPVTSTSGEPDGWLMKGSGGNACLSCGAKEKDGSSDALGFLGPLRKVIRGTGGIVPRKQQAGTSLVVQWLRFHSFPVWGCRSDPWLGS